MRQLDRSAIGALVDVSAVRADVTQAEVDEVIRIVRQYHCVCAAPMAWMATSLPLGSRSSTSAGKGM